MEHIHDGYQELYRKLKSEVVRELDEMDVTESRKTDLLERIRFIPHPEVATVFDVRDVCEDIQAGPLEHLYPLVGQQAGELLQELEEDGKQGRGQNLSQDETINLEQVQRTLNYQSELLRDITARSGQAARGVSRTLKSNCVSCGSDLKLFVDQTGSTNELTLSCRSCSNKWPLRSVP